MSILTMLKRKQVLSPDPDPHQHLNGSSSCTVPSLHKLLKKSVKLFLRNSANEHTNKTDGYSVRRPLTLLAASSPPIIPEMIITSSHNYHTLSKAQPPPAIINIQPLFTFSFPIQSLTFQFEPGTSVSQLLARRTHRNQDNSPTPPTPSEAAQWTAGWSWTNPQVPQSARCDSSQRRRRMRRRRRPGSCSDSLRGPRLMSPDAEAGEMSAKPSTWPDSDGW